MTISIDDILTPMSLTACETSIYTVLGWLGVPTTGWKPGGVARAIVTMVATMQQAASEMVSNIGRSAFFSSASGDWLSMVAQQTYGVNRIEATFADGTVLLTNSGGGDYSSPPLGVGEVIVSCSNSGKTYVNTSEISLGPATSATGTFRAEDSGAASNALPGEIDTMQTALVGVTCSNTTTFVAADEQSDESLRSTIESKIDSLSPCSPAQAYNYAMLHATRADGTSLGVTRSTTVGGSTTGAVYVYVASAAGGTYTGDSEDPSTDLGRLTQIAQETVAPIGPSVFVKSAINQPIDVVYAAYSTVSSSYSATASTGLISSAVEEFLSSMSIGGRVIPGDTVGRLYRDELTAAIRSAVPSVFHVAYLVPWDGTEIQQGHVATLGSITGAVILVTS